MIESFATALSSSSRSRATKVKAAGITATDTSSSQRDAAFVVWPLTSSSGSYRVTCRPDTQCQFEQTTLSTHHVPRRGVSKRRVG